MTTEGNFFIRNRIRRRRLFASWFCDYFLFGLFFRLILKEIYYKRLVANAMNLGLKRDKKLDHSDEFVARLNGYASKVRFSWKWGIVIRAMPHSADFERSCDSNGLSRTPLPRLFLENNKSVQYGNEHDVDFNTNNQIFNFIFKLRRADIHTAKVLTTSPDLLDHFVRFYEKWMDSLSHFAVISSQLECTLDHVGLFYSCITPDVFKDLLTDLIGLVAHFDDEMEKKEFNRENISNEKVKKTKN